MSKFQMVWFMDCMDNEEKKEERRKNLLQSSEICDIIRDVIARKITTLETVTEKDYENPSWAYRQAHNNGKKQAYEEIMTLLDFPRE